MNYYNEIDKQCANWIRNLIQQGLLPQGDVDERSIEDVKPSELKGYRQCHFFAGICGWPLALRIAGIENESGIWTGSCPCQPFSSAGKRNGIDDERHLWPAWFHLISQCKPDIIFGEQVKAATKQWLDIVGSDLESQGYAFGSAVLGAHSVGSPHSRNRIFFVADSGSPRSEAWLSIQARRSKGDSEISLDNSSGTLRPWKGAGMQRGKDGKSRWIESSIAPLANGVSSRVVELRAYGNAIVPQVAAEFVMSFIDE